MENLESVEIDKGDTAIQLSLSRGRKGILIWCKVQPHVEALLRELGNEEVTDTRVSGRFWENVKGTDPIQIYGLRAGHGILGAGDNIYRLDRPGQALLDPPDPVPVPGSPIAKATPFAEVPVNISFLRLVGLSEPDGKTFVVRGVYSRDELLRIGERIKKAVGSFYATYLKPVKVSITLSTQTLT